MSMICKMKVSITTDRVCKHVIHALSETLHKIVSEKPTHTHIKRVKRIVLLWKLGIIVVISWSSLRLYFLVRKLEIIVLSWLSVNLLRLSSSRVVITVSLLILSIRVDIIVVILCKIWVAIAHPITIV